MPTTRRQMNAQAIADKSPPSKMLPLKTSSSRAIEATDNIDDKLPSDEQPEILTNATYMFEGVTYPTYQDMVNAKRKRNEQVLQGLGFLDTSKSTASQRGIKKQKTTMEQVPRRKSSRLSSEKATLVALDYYVNDWNRDNAVVHVQGDDPNDEEEASKSDKVKYYKGRLNDGSDITVKDSVEMMDNKWINDDSVESAEKFVQETLMALSMGTSDESASKQSSTTCVTVTASVCDLVNQVGNLSIDNEEWVAKVTPDRIISVATHPSESKLIACAGDKWGYIGLWDVDAPHNDNHNGVHLFRVHSRHVCGLEWATGDTMISASYDGTIRRLNVETGTFQEIFASYDETNTYYAEDLGFGLDDGYDFWHQHVTLDHRFGGADPCLFLATSVGKAIHLDLRSTDKQRITFNEKLSDRKINTLR